MLILATGITGITTHNILDVRTTRTYMWKKLKLLDNFVTFTQRDIYHFIEQKQRCIKGSRLKTSFLVHGIEFRFGSSPAPKSAKVSRAFLSEEKSIGGTFMGWLPQLQSKHALKTPLMLVWRIPKGYWLTHNNFWVNKRNSPHQIATSVGSGEKRLNIFYSISVLY